MKMIRLQNNNSLILIASNSNRKLAVANSYVNIMPNFKKSSEVETLMTAKDCCKMRTMNIQIMPMISMIRVMMMSLSVTSRSSRRIIRQARLIWISLPRDSGLLFFKSNKV